MDKQVGNVQLMQKMNRLKVLDFVRHNRDVSRPSIAEHTGLSLASITNITTYLFNRGLLYESGTEQVGRVGRKSTLLRFCAERYNLICVYIREQYIHIAYTDLEGTPLESVRIGTEGLSFTNVTEELQAAVKTIVDLHDKSRILGIGVAISGLVLSDSRLVLSSGLKWKSVDIRELITAVVDLPVFVDNVSMLKAAWHFSQKRTNNLENAIFVDMENGISAVQYVNGEIAHSTLGKIGHTTVESDGVECFCGNHGCLEAMCSPERVLSLYEQYAGKPAESLSEVDKLCRYEDEAAVKAIEECGKYLGIGLANLISLFNPSMLVIDTGDFEECSTLLLTAERELHRRTYPALTKKLLIRQVNEFKDNILCGMAFNLCDRLFNISFPDNIVE
ncbi:MAG: ROK family protein [Clostridia bacterium]|nr:ROK family protein [Clostridia bacterium]